MEPLFSLFGFWAFSSAKIINFSQTPKEMHGFVFGGLILANEGNFLTRIGFSYCGVGKNTFISPIFAVSLQSKTRYNCEVAHARQSKQA
jgi:hypothetical protein